MSQRLKPHEKNLATIKEWEAVKRGDLYTRIENLEGVPYSYLRVLIKLLRHCQDSGGGGLFPSYAALSAKSPKGNFIHIKTVQRALRFWRLNRVIRVLPKKVRHGGEGVGGWESNEYELGVNPLSLSTEDLRRRTTAEFLAVVDKEVDKMSTTVVDREVDREVDKMSDKGLPSEDLLLMGSERRSEGVGRRKPKTPDERNDGASDEGRGDADEDAEYDEALRHEILSCALEEHRKQDHSADLGI